MEIIGRFFPSSPGKRRLAKHVFTALAVAGEISPEQAAAAIIATDKTDKKSTGLILADIVTAGRELVRSLSDPGADLPPAIRQDAWQVVQALEAECSVQPVFATPQTFSRRVLFAQVLEKGRQAAVWVGITPVLASASVAYAGFTRREAYDQALAARNHKLDVLTGLYPQRDFSSFADSQEFEKYQGGQQVRKKAAEGINWELPPHPLTTVALSPLAGIASWVMRMVIGAPIILYGNDSREIQEMLDRPPWKYLKYL